MTLPTVRLPAGWLPALTASNLPLPSWLISASAMTERQELPVQSTSTFLGADISSSLSLSD